MAEIEVPEKENVSKMYHECALPLLRKTHGGYLSIGRIRMQKHEAVTWLQEKGYQASNESGVVVVLLKESGAAFEKTLRKIHKEIKAAGYLASFGARSEGCYEKNKDGGEVDEKAEL